ncbi:hypothetical protein BDW22DRAFT_1273828 [Trametopsis cervina]|nr:hypothetical protein BDW22DRAFT_1273828 [Trametopsis cervina]
MDSFRRGGDEVDDSAHVGIGEPVGRTGLSLCFECVEERLGEFVPYSWNRGGREILTKFLGLRRRRLGH